MSAGSACPDLSNTRDTEIFKSYLEVVGNDDKKAFALWEAKNGYSLTQDSEGKPHKVYQAYLEQGEFQAKRHAALYDYYKKFNTNPKGLQEIEDFVNSKNFTSSENSIEELKDILRLFNYKQEEGFFQSKNLSTSHLRQRLDNKGFSNIGISVSTAGTFYITQNNKKYNPFKTSKSFYYSSKDKEFSSFEMMDIKTRDRITKEKELRGETEVEKSFVYYKNRLQEQLNYLTTKLKEAKRNKNYDLISKYEDAIDKRELLLNDIINRGVEDSIVEIAQNQLEFVSKALNKPNISSDDLSELLHIVRLYSNITDTGSDFSLLTENDLKPEVYFDEELNKEVEDLPEFTKNLQEIESKAKSLEQRVMHSVKKEVVTIAQNILGEKYNEKKLFEDIGDIGAIAAEVLDASRLGVGILDTMHALLANTKTVSDKETTNKLKENEEYFEEFKKSSYYKANGFKHFFDISQEGSVELTSAYNKKYHQEYKQALSNIYSKNKNKIKKGQDWFKENHIYVPFFTTEADKNKILESLKDKIEDHRAEELIEESQLKFQEFLEAKKSHKEFLQQEYKNNPLEVDIHMEDWIQENDPVKVLERLNSGASVKSLVDPKKFIRNNFSYISFIPTKENHSENFDLIAQDDAAVKYYNFIKNRLAELYSVYPPDILDKNGVIPTSIPVQEKKFLDKVKKEGLTGVAAYTGDFFKKAISIDKRFDVAHGRIDPKTGKTLSSLPIYMLSDKGLTPEQRNLHLNEVINSFTVVTSAYKYKAVVETPLMMIRESIDTIKEKIKTPSGLNVKYTEGGEQQINDGLKRIKAIADFNINVFYGEPKKHTGVSTKTIKTKEEKEKLKKLDAQKKELDKRAENLENLSDEEVNEIIKEHRDLAYEYEKIGVNLATSAVIRSLMRYVSLKNLGWNPNSMMVEGIYGMIANMQHAVGREDFNLQQLFSSTGKVIAALNPANIKAHKKYSKFIEYFDVVGELHEMNNNVNNSRIQKGWKRLGPFSFLRFADRFYKGAATLAYLKNIKITGKDGTEIELYDAFDENMELLDNFATEENIKEWGIKTGVDAVFKSNKLLNTINRTTQMNKMITGNYDPKSAVKISENIYGEAATQFRKWMYEGWAQRIQTEKEDPYLGRKVKGRWRSYVDIVENEGETITKGLANLSLRVLNGLVWNNKSAYKGLDNSEVYGEYTEANMRKNINGIRIFLMLLVVLKGLKELSDDEDKTTGGLALNYFINQGYRLHSDISFYSSPSSAQDILGNIVALGRIFDDSQRFTEAVLKSIEGDTRFKMGAYKGMQRVPVRTLELVPFTNAFLKTYKQGQEIFPFNK